MPRHNPATPLTDPTHEAYVLRRAQGIGPTEAGADVGLENFRVVERQASFRDRLQLLEMVGDKPVDPKLTLEWLVIERKRALSRALASNQLKNADQHLSKLEELYERHPQLRGDEKQRKPRVVSDAELDAAEARLSVAPSEAANG